MRRAVAVVLVLAAACGGRQHGGSAAGCAEAAAGAARNLRAIRGDLAEAGVDPGPPLAALCRRDGWSEAAIRCYRDAANPRDAHTCTVRLDDLQRLHARNAQDELFTRARRVLRERRLAAAATGIPECDDYSAEVDSYLQCNKLPPAARDAIGQSRDEIIGAVKKAGPDYHDRLAVQCKQFADRLRQTMKNMGCT